jgi:hypothetical protein
MVEGSVRLIFVMKSQRKIAAWVIATNHNGILIQFYFVSINHLFLFSVSLYCIPVNRVQLFEEIFFELTKILKSFLTISAIHDSCVSDQGVDLWDLKTIVDYWNIRNYWRPLLGWSLFLRWSSIRLFGVSLSLSLAILVNKHKVFELAEKLSI